jgi:effector-binding domain-containing protein
VTDEHDVPSAARRDQPAASHCEVALSNAMVVAARAYRGPASGVPQVFDDLLAWAEARHVEPFGPLVGVYHDLDDPGAGVLRVEAWLPLDPTARATDPQDRTIRIKDVPPQLMAQTTFRGFPGDMEVAFEELWEFLSERGLRRSDLLHRQVYVDMPPGSPGYSIIEIQLPVE